MPPKAKKFSSSSEMTTFSCPNCRFDSTVNLGEVPPPVEVFAREYVAVREFAESLLPSFLCLCPLCKLMFRSQLPTVESLRQFYVHLSAKNWNYDPKTVGSWNLAARMLRERYSSEETICVLDVGAFNGDFLSMLPQAWMKCAVEPNEHAVVRLRKLGIRHEADFIDDVRLLDHKGKFDIITLFDVFEHLLDVDATLTRLVTLLKPGGRLLVSTGNANHWTWWLLNAHHWYLHTIQHLCIGSTVFFAGYGKKKGLIVEKQINHGHRMASSFVRYQDTMETLYWWSRLQDGTLSFPAKLIQRLPACQDFMHKQSSPFASSLRDHSLFMFRTGVGTDAS